MIASDMYPSFLSHLRLTHQPTEARVLITLILQMRKPTEGRMGTVTVLSRPAAEHTRIEGSGLPGRCSPPPARCPCPRCRSAGVGKSLSLRAARGLYRLTTLSAEDGLWNFRGRKCFFPAHNLLMCFLEKKGDTVMFMSPHALSTQQI